MRPCSLRLIFPLVLLSLLSISFYLKYRPPYGFYSSLLAAELQHAEQYTTQPKYVRFQQLQGAGFTNQAQEILLYHHLALSTGRTYVYQPFIWNPRRASLPLSAFLLGPTNDSLSDALFERVCPQVKHVEIVAQPNDLWAEAQRVLGNNDRCISVDNKLFTWRYLYEHFAWPAHIQDMASRAYTYFGLHSARYNPQGLPYIAIHLRRGDFGGQGGHCENLANTPTEFTTWANLPSLRSSIFPPALEIANRTSMIEHCYPTLHRILDAIDFHLKSHPNIRAAYFLHDGTWDHLNVYIQYYKLEYALKNTAHAKAVGRSAPLTVVSHSGQLPVDWGERDWKVTVDIELARRAELFIGNGYSSLTSQIIALRLADGGSEKDIGLV